MSTVREAAARPASFTGADTETAVRRGGVRGWTARHPVTAFLALVMTVLVTVVARRRLGRSARLALDAAAIPDSPQPATDKAHS